MNTRAFTLALLISVFAMFMVHTYIEDQQSAMIKRYGTESSVVVAKVDIKELELIDDRKIKVISVPQNFLAPGHFKTMREVENTVATMPILKGEQITKPRLTFPGAKTGLSRQVSVGRRAIAINITSRQAVSKLIKPGDRVDVIAAINYAAGRQDMKRIKTVLQDVMVLSTGLNMSNSIPIIGIKTPRIIKKMNLSTYSRYNTVTLELTPNQVQRILYIKTFFPEDIYLSLRNNSDKERIRVPPTKLLDILGEDAPEAKAYFQEKYRKR